VELVLRVDLAAADLADAAEGMEAVLDASADLDLPPALVRLLLALDEAITDVYERAAE
jgi:hypothetical protein